MTRRISFVLIIALAVGAVLVLRLRERPELPTSSHENGEPVASRPSLPIPLDYTEHPVMAAGEEDAGPARIISLAPSITETLCALGLRDRIVGRTRHCVHPPGIVDEAPPVGTLMDTDYGMIKKLKPDLVLATWNSGDVPESLRKLGIRCETLPHETLDDIHGAIERIGRLCERPAGAALLNDAIRRDIAAQQDTARALGMKPMSVLVTTGPLPVPPRELWVAGPGSFLEELLHLAGHENAAGGLGRAFTELPLVTLLQINPEVILEFRDSGEADDREELYREWSRLGTLQAIRQRRVRTVGGLEWLSAGPRVAIGLHHLVATMAEFR